MAAIDVPTDEEYEKGLDALSSLISGRVRADGKTWSHAFEMMQVYLERLQLEKELSKLSVIHVAGTKGKGSTCAMIESILRQAGYKTGLYTSPHLIDVRERIRINGVPIDKATFLRQLWAAYHTLADKANEDAGKPAYFRFLTLLGFKIFLEQQVEVAILEVGLGGRLDATNCVRKPVVCGVTALGFDHVALLGNTLPEIAREKAGIFKPGKPAFTVPQREDAEGALKEVAERVGAPLEGVRPLDEYILGDSKKNGVAATQSNGDNKGDISLPSASQLKLGLAGEHQRQNASLAVILAAEWEARNAAKLEGSAGEAARQRAENVRKGILPPEYAAGLKAAKWPGRGQIVEYDAEAGCLLIDSSSLFLSSSSPSVLTAASRLTFFLDGAHTAESMVPCANWFADAASERSSLDNAPTHRVLLFNCMEERDPNNLLGPLGSTLAQRGALPSQALFVPPESTYMKLGPADEIPDLTWQLTLRGVWEKLGAGSKGAVVAPVAFGAGAGAGAVQGCVQGNIPLPALPPLPRVPGVAAYEVGAVLPNLRVTVDWLRKCVRETPTVRMQVLVTGSLYLIGDLLRILGRGSE